MFIEFMNEYGLKIIYSLIMGLVSYALIAIKRLYKKITIEKVKEETVKMVCRAIEQTCENMSGEEKLNRAIINSKEILKEKGINISDLELRIYIENSVCFVKNEIEVRKKWLL